MAIESLTDLPIEILTPIIDHVVTREVPFRIQHVIDLARELKILQVFDNAHPTEFIEPNPAEIPLPLSTYRDACAQRVDLARELKDLHAFDNHQPSDSAEPEPLDMPLPPGPTEWAERRDLRRKAGLLKAKDAATYTDVTTLMTAAYPNQRPHLQDWVFVNSTCHRIRAIGKRALFTHKALYFELPFFWDFAAGTALSISTESQRLAVSCVKTVIIRSHHTRAVDFQRLPRIQRQLPALQKFGIYLHIDNQYYQKNLWTTDEGGLFDIAEWDAFPERLRRCLRNIGFDVDSIRTGFVNSTRNGKMRRYSQRLRNSPVYVGLEAYAAVLQGRQASPSKVEAPEMVQ